MTQTVSTLIKLQTLDNDVDGGAVKATPYRLRKRREMMQQIPEPAMRNYNRLRTRHSNAIVPVINGVCQGCYMQLPPAIQVRLTSLRDQTCCDRCGRILYLPDPN